MLGSTVAVALPDGVGVGVTGPHPDSDEAAAVRPAVQGVEDLAGGRLRVEDAGERVDQLIRFGLLRGDHALQFARPDAVMLLDGACVQGEAVAVVLAGGVDAAAREVGGVACGGRGALLG